MLLMDKADVPPWPFIPEREGLLGLLCGSPLER